MQITPISSQLKKSQIIRSHITSICCCFDYILVSLCLNFEMSGSFLSSRNPVFHSRAISDKFSFKNFKKLPHTVTLLFWLASFHFHYSHQPHCLLALVPLSLSIPLPPFSYPPLSLSLLSNATQFYFTRSLFIFLLGHKVNHFSWTHIRSKTTTSLKWKCRWSLKRKNLQSP